jgi:hypothetical protein
MRLSFSHEGLEPNSAVSTAKYLFVGRPYVSGATVRDVLSGNARSDHFWEASKDRDIPL